MITHAIDIKKVFVSVIVVLAFALLLLPTAAGASGSSKISIKGGFPGYNPPVGSVVTVKCGSQTNSPKTDNKGKFSTTFNKTSDCTKGTVITGSFEMYYGTSKVSNSYNTDTLQLRKTEAVPEIGTVAAIASLALVGGAIVYTRRRQAQF